MKIREDASILPDFHFTGCVDCIDARAASLRSPCRVAYDQAESLRYNGVRRKAGVYARREADAISFRTEAKTPGHAGMPPALFDPVHSSAVISANPVHDRLVSLFLSFPKERNVPPYPRPSVLSPVPAPPDNPL